MTAVAVTVDIRATDERVFVRKDDRRAGGKKKKEKGSEGDWRLATRGLMLVTSRFAIGYQRLTTAGV